jgi:hypothetical protein
MEMGWKSDGIVEGDKDAPREQGSHVDLLMGVFAHAQLLRSMR